MWHPNCSRTQNLSLFLATASGVELDPKSPFQGPHVGSYHNRLFKRAILSNSQYHPVILFLDEDKVPSAFIPGKCYSVCDPDFSWDSAP